MNCALSTIAAWSSIGQWLGCFCPAMLIGGEGNALMQLFGMLLDGFLEKGWARDAEMVACKSECQ